MKVKILFSYVELVIPPRCRKARPERFNDGEIAIDIPEVTAAEAPVAIRSRGRFLHDESKEYSVDYRWWNGRLWTSVHTDGVEPRGRHANKDNWGWPCWPTELDVRGEYRNVSYAFGVSDSRCDLSRTMVERSLTALASENLIVDGVFYRPEGEPRYVVMTFGLGQNHGGTAVMIDTSFNDNINRSRYFSLLERERAVACATEIATRRGDTLNLPIVPHGPDWEILLPEAIKVRSESSPTQPDTDEATVSAYATLVKALEAAQQALQNVPKIGDAYDEQRAEAHRRAGLDVEKALKRAAGQKHGEQVAINRLLEEVDAHLDYEDGADLRAAAEEVREHFPMTA